ncbi:MAG: T9SS type A sorting domain-containing protein [Bacteroidia bacterium]|nr:T9SS type A sorting domain-containing protein [Bacteroidia bacterium]
MSNTIACGFNKAYVIYLQDKNGSHHFLTGDSTLYTWEESGGEVRFTAKAISAPGLDGTFDVDLIFSGKTTTPPTNSPKQSNCFTTGSTTGWLYYPNTSGTIVSTDYGTMTVGRRGEAFQLGNNANITMQGFGASAWLDLNGGTGDFSLGDINVMLSAPECDTSDVKTCKNTALEFCVNDLFNLDSINGGDVTIKSVQSQTSHGVTTVLGNDQSTSDPGCCDDGKPTGFTFKYVTSNIISNSQTDGKSSVTTYTAPAGQTVLIVANGNSTAGDTSNSFFRWTVDAGETISMDKSISDWNSNTYFHIMNESGTKVLQLVKFHTSCSAPIIPGDQFGTLVLQSSSLDGNVCGIVEGDCEAEVVYFPNPDFIGWDTVTVEVCYSSGSGSVCQDLEFSVEVNSEDSICPPLCPTGKKPVYVKSTSSGIVKYDAKDKHRAEGLPDGDFAKLEDKGDFITLSLQTLLKAGDTMDVVIASYDGQLAEGTIQGSEDGVTFGPAIDISTKMRKPLIDTERIRFWTNTQFVRINLDDNSEGKLLIDGIEYNGVVCSPDVEVEVETNTCKNNPVTICVDDALNLDSLFGTSVSIKSAGSTSNNGGSVWVESTTNTDQGCCDAGKPTGFTFKYVSSNVIDNNQGDGKSSVTTLSDPNGAKVLIVANGNSTAGDTSNSFFRWTVDAGETISMDKSISDWNSNTYFHIMNESGTTVLQLVKFHTSCSAPIVPGDQFGTLVLMSSSLDGVVCGSTEECTNFITYFPPSDFSGTDTLAFDVCIQDNGFEVCDEAIVIVEVADSVCNKFCPDGQLPVKVAATSSGILSSDAHDKSKGVGSPDGDFAKLEHNDEQITLALGAILAVGDSIDIVIASYDGKLAEAVVSASVDGSTFTQPQLITTTTEKPSTETVSFRFPVNAEFVRIQRVDGSSGKFLVDGVSFEGTECRPELPKRIELETCIDAPITWDFSELLPDANPTTWTVEVSQNPTDGSLSVTDSYVLNGCSLDDPKKLTMVYTGEGCDVSNHDQGGDFKCDDKKDISTYSSVYIIVNDEKDEKDRLSDKDKYFDGVVSTGDVVSIDAALNGDSELPNKIYVWIMDTNDDKVIQKMEIKTDCNKPISLYDQFGSLGVTGYTAANNNGELTPINNLFESTYTPNNGFVGLDSLTLELCHVEGDTFCQEVTYLIEVGSEKPVALNDTADDLDVVSGLSTTLIKVLDNDYHPTSKPFKLQWPLLTGPTLTGATVEFDSASGGINYIINDPKNDDLDSFLYVIETACAMDTAKVYVKFGSALPVEFISFTAELLDHQTVELNWITASELNNSHFEIERAVGNGEYQTIGWPVRGAGTTTEVQYYQEMDMNVPNGVIYYRIKQVDFDGNFEYSDVRFVIIDPTTKMLVFPNPANGTVHVHFKAGRNQEIRLTNLAGQEVDRFQLANEGGLSFETSNYPQGIYFLRVSSGDETVVKRLVIRR